MSSHFCPYLKDLPVQTGTFPCGKCDVCSFLANSKDVPLPTGHVHNIKHCVTCKTIGVVYLALCQCGCFHIGKTKRPFFKRNKDHILPLFKKRTTTALNRYVGCQHKYDATLIRLYALEHVPLHVRGGSIDVTLLQLETRWIHSLDAVRYPGLN